MMITDTYIRRKSEILKAISHPIRLCIVKGLLEDEGCSVKEMQHCLQVPQSTISQHLCKLKNAGIVEGKREGVEIHYFVIEPEIERLMNTLFCNG